MPGLWGSDEGDCMLRRHLTSAGGWLLRPRSLLKKSREHRTQSTEHRPEARIHRLQSVLCELCSVLRPPAERLLRPNMRFVLVLGLTAYFLTGAALAAGDPHV